MTPSSLGEVINSIPSEFGVHSSFFWSLFTIFTLELAKQQELEHFGGVVVVGTLGVVEGGRVVVVVGGDTGLQKKQHGRPSSFSSF